MQSTQDVSKKTVASILNHMIRVFVLPAPNKPVKVFTESEDIQYNFNSDTLRHQVKDSFLNDKTKFESFEPHIEVVWNKIKTTKPDKPYNYNWNIEILEKDHLIEVQHIVKMLTYTGALGETTWSNLSLGSIVHLGYYLNDQRNLWLIPKAFNQAKAYIPLLFWYGSIPPNNIYRPPMTDEKQRNWRGLQLAIAQDYLFNFCTEDGRTPFTELLSLAAEMAGLSESETMTFLTVKAGKSILALLESWSKQIDKVNLRGVRDGSNISDKSKSGTWTPKQTELYQKRVKGLTLFASDVAHEVAEMNRTVAIQTSPRLSDDQTIPQLLIQTIPQSSKVQTIATHPSLQSDVMLIEKEGMPPDAPDYVSDDDWIESN